MDIKVFLYIAVLSYSATEVIKGILNVYIPKLKVGLLLAFILSTSFIAGLGIGLVSFLSGVQYDSVMIPYLFQGVDLLTTGAILSLGSKGFKMSVSLRISRPAYPR